MKLRKKILLLTVTILCISSLAGVVYAMTEGEKWTQFKGKGITLNFLTEDTPAAGAILDLLPEFAEKTGIKVNVTRTNVGDLVTKLMLELGSGSSEIDIIYAARWQIPPAYSSVLVDVSRFNNDPTLPHIPMDDFFKPHLISTSHFVDKQRQIGVPHDASTLIWFYRKDIFDKYKKAFMAAKGYDWTPGPNLNWEQYKEIARWINDNVSEVKYGAGHMAKQWNSLYCDFSNVFWAWGARGFENPKTESWGVIFPGRCLWDSPEAIEAAKFYKDLINNVAHPSGPSWDWSDLAEAFAKGDEIAMCFEWHDFVVTFEDPARSKVPGKVGVALAPKGKDGKSHNYYSGAALAINSYVPEDHQRAAWLFLVWQSSMPVQKAIFKKGSTPVRKSAYQDPEVRQWIAEKRYPGAGIADVMYEAWKPENLEYVEAKMPMFVETLIIQYTELAYMLQGLKTPEQAMKDIVDQVNQATGWTDLQEKLKQ